MTTQYIANTQSYIHRKIAGDHVLIPVGNSVYEFNGVINMNAAAAFIWDAMKAPVTKAELVEKMMDEYEVDQTTLEADVDEILNVFLERKMVNRV